VRLEFEDAIYRLGAPSNARQAVFHDERDCARFLKAAERIGATVEAVIPCFVLMGNQFHLVAQTHSQIGAGWMV
jgi:hypothetical protein